MQRTLRTATLRIPVDTFIRLNVLLVAGLVLAGTMGQIATHGFGHDHVWGLIPMFHLNGEGNVPAWYSAAMLLLCGAVLAAIAGAKHHERDRFAWHWVVLAILFVFLSLDETVQLHERAGRALRAALNLSGWMYHAWVYPWGAGLLVLGLSFRPWLQHLPRATRIQLLTAGIVFVAGALGLEIVEGRYASVHGKETLLYDVFVTVEESCEMIGVLIFLRALLAYVARTVGPMQVEVAAVDSATAPFIETSRVPGSRAPGNGGLR